MGRWQYLTRDWDPEGNQSEEDWARGVAAEGWQMWIGPGIHVMVNGKTVKRWAVRRWVDDPPASPPR